ncbi:hypothetical protein AFM11_22030 [Mycolicibacterium wolinskyi]|uniref:Uncharacterized protein n=1 Tax=Mycolicibacterium wolinskyi TaxID=59750 RepID=A0A132PIP4_9MYCO|nr:hypothetical protein [Mycolicibacterium wolinskyi]KWX22173.1 hypothetical protein AFM11_22030 [Mycolicibacterium wolinskyi]
MDDPVAWPSLADQIDIATSLFGERGVRMVGAWLAEQTARIDDLQFARTFSDHITLPGIRPADYAHRHLRTGRGDLIGGIRFYCRDLARPFVEVVAHSFEDVAALADCVRAEWAAFAPGYLRLRARPGRITGPGVVLDVSIHAARHRDITACDGRVRLHPFTDAQQAVDLVSRRYEHLAATQPALAHNITPADPADIRQWHDDGRLRAIEVCDEIVGAIAIVPGAVGWLGGDEVNEEVISAEHCGHGYAVSAQTAWAAYVATDHSQMLVGTIDRHNPASRKTAERAGRPRVLDDVFVALRGRVRAR